jgi:hypothetical protein
MKKAVLLIIISCVCFIGHSQGNYMSFSQTNTTNQKLIEENGWNIFKLGTHISKYKSRLIYFSSNIDDNVYIYKHDESIRNYLNIPIKYILLIFDDNEKLVVIRIILDSERFMENYYVLNLELQEKYGVAFTENYTKLSHEFSWGSGNAPILYSNFNFSCNDKGYIELSVMYVDMVFLGYLLLKETDNSQMIDEDGNPLQLILKNK